MDVAVSLALALAPLPVRGQEVVSVRGGHCPRHARLVVAHVESGRGLLTATRSRRGSSRSRRDRSRSSDRYRSRRERARSPARRGERRDRSRSHASLNRSIDRSRSIERLPASSARSREDGAGRLGASGDTAGVTASGRSKKEISKTTVSFWLRKTISRAYELSGTALPVPVPPSS